MENLQLLDVVENSIHEIHKSAENKEVELINTVDSEIYAFADKHMLNVILRNLLSNAIKYVDSGDKISVSAHEKADSVELSVQDTGKGIHRMINLKIYLSLLTA